MDHQQLDGSYYMGNSVPICIVAFSKLTDFLYQIGSTEQSNPPFFQKLLGVTYFEFMI